MTSSDRTSAMGYEHCWGHIYPGSVDNGAGLPRVPAVYQRWVLDFANRGTVAGFAAVLWEVRHSISAVPQMARQGNVGVVA